MSNKRLCPPELLLPENLDRLAVIGSGTSARVLRYGAYAIKVAHPDPASRQRLADEIINLDSLRLPGIRLPRLFASDPDAGVLVRTYIKVERLFDLLAAGAEPSEELWGALWVAFGAVEEKRRETGRVVDFTPANLFVDRVRATVWMADAGWRLDPPALADLARGEFVAAMHDALRWQAKLEAPGRLGRFSLPPSGRFHVEVAMGVPSGARLLWQNDRLARRLDVDWSRTQLLRLGGLSAQQPDGGVFKLATRYKDAPAHIDGGAQGDGRVVYLGTLAGGPYGRRELTLKGCGPTPLVWRGHTYHEDGLVSFNRILWETAVCEELARLGFVTPEVLAICSSPFETIDNTDRPWPTATAIRVCDTHYRLGHLWQWVEEPAAFCDLLAEIGRQLRGDDFDPRRRRDLTALVMAFADTFGWDIGRTDALNIQGFNPTAGNIRVDGHLLDFSSVRFFRHAMPEYRILDGKRRAEDHRLGMRRKVTELVGYFTKTRLLSDEVGRQLGSRALSHFDTRYDAGYLDGIGAFLGFRGPEPAPGLLRHWVDESRRLRALRAEAEISFPFFKQTHHAPLFDLEGQGPELIEAWQGGAVEPWRELRSDFDGEVTPFAEHVADSWMDLTRRLLPAASLAACQPRRFEEVIRPFMEVNALVRLCYERTTVNDLRAWRHSIETASHLPAGDYTYLGARTAALALGHCALRGALPHRYERVVGLMPALRGALCEPLSALGDAGLLGVLAYGSRVMTAGRAQRLSGSGGATPQADLLVERDWAPVSNTPLELVWVVRRDALEAMDWQARAGRAGAELSTPFPIQIQLATTDSSQLSEAVERWYARSPIEIGLDASSWQQVVVLFDAAREADADVIAAVAAPLPFASDRNDRVSLDALPSSPDRNLDAETGCRLGLHQLEICLRDLPDREPPAPIIERADEGWRVIEGWGAIEAARRAGRRTIAI